MDSIDGVRLDPREQAELTAQILERALAGGRQERPEDRRARSARTQAEEDSLRDGLEATYRQLAGIETDDRAGATRWSTRRTPCEGGPYDDRPSDAVRRPEAGTAPDRPSTPQPDGA